MSRICLVGAGYISRVHLDALRTLPGHQVVAVVDPNQSSAAALAKGANAGADAATYASVDAALAANLFDRAHVLVPPDRHEQVALPLLAAGKPVLLEKPLAETREAAQRLVDAPGAPLGAALGVNQNFVHHPAFARLRAAIDARRLGHPRFVGCTYNVPLRQLGLRQFGHWMFQQPGNILLEQAVHPLSQITTLTGPIADFAAIAGPSIEISPGVPFVATLNASLQGTLIPAQLRFAVGQDFPFWQIQVVCDDGVITADILANRVFTYDRTRWLPAVDEALAGLRTAAALASDSVRGVLNYSLSTAKLRPRSDAFFLSMQASIAAFHTALDRGEKLELDATFGAGLVTLCERLRDATFPTAEPRPPTAGPASDPPDVAILGGTGFIGSHVVRAFLDAGQRVAVMARNTTNLAPVFHDPRVTLHRGDIRNADSVATAIKGARVVVNLAHGGGGASFEAVRAAMVGGAETVANACLAAGTQRLLYVGSIASLYLGPQATPITSATPPDPEDEKRGDYARAKAHADRAMLAMFKEKGLPVVILRPGVVVGEGGLPFHSGVGLYNNDQHCIGWNAGRNPLPFILVEDVADAILRAASAPGIEGRCYNLVGDVRLSARDYTAALANALARPLQYHPQSANFLWAEDTGKWLVKRATGRNVPAPSVRDFLSRGMMAAFDTADAKRDLNWTPIADPARFIDRAIRIHTSSPSPSGRGPG
jgi:nucleoside-diphosphate-sugar epimerase/predicted dehydrogenase